MRIMRFPVIILLNSFVGFINSAKILCLFTVPFYSHQSVLNIFTKELSSRGHELLVISSVKQVLQNVKEINTKNISEAVWNQRFTPNVNIIYKRNHKTDAIATISLSLKTMHDIMDAIFGSPEVQDLIHNKHEEYDLILIEECVPANIIIAARFNAPIIFVSSYHANYVGLRVTGSEVNPIYYASNNFGKILWNSPVWEKLTALIYSFRLDLLYCNIEQSNNDLIKKHFGYNTHMVQELINKVQMMFLNTYQFWDFSRPVPPSVIYTGGIHLQEPKALPDDLQSYLDNATNGVLYMSFGSKFKCSDLPEETFQVIVKVLVSLPYKVIWKMDGELPEKQSNIRAESWLPQNDVLHHPSVKVFITHAGLQSTDEAIAAGVPLVALPLYADQFTNANNYVLHGIGIKLNINTLNENEFREAITKVAENKRNNIKKMENIMRQHRSVGLNKVMHYIDYVLKHGNTNLHSPSTNLFEEYYQLDVVIPVVAFLIITMFFLIMLSKILFCKIIIIFRFKMNALYLNTCPN